MKKVIFSLILGLTIIFVHKVFEIDYTVKKSLEYCGCEVSYEHSYINFYFSNWNTHCHSTSNERQLTRAKHELANCLCGKYLQSKDTIIERYIIDFFNNDSLAQRRYYGTFKYLNRDLKPDINDLCKYKDLIFQYTILIQ